ncbi:MAG: hypothetical protein Q9160_003221 [Pyrenula sp. 1 TL-2023]
MDSVAPSALPSKNCGLTSTSQGREEEPIGGPSLQYETPTAGILSWVPYGLVPYIQLMRFEKPHGYYTFLFPHMYGLLWASIALEQFDTRPSASISASKLTDITPILKSCLLPLAIPAGWFILGSVFLRGAACTWNDTIDAPYDRLVTRCRHRPIARGAVSPNRAHAFTILQSLAGLVILAQLPNSAACTVYALPLAILIALYPWAKRVTNYPQVLLGVALSCGQLVGAAAALGLKPETGVPDRGTKALELNILTELDVRSTSKSRISEVAACFFGANVLSAVIVDTVYAHQDLQDDIKAGLKSTAILWQERTRLVLGVLSVAKVALLAFAGVIMDLHASYFVLAVGGTAIVLGVMTCNVDLRDAEDCGHWFRHSILWSGLAIMAGLCGGLINVHVRN